MNPIYDIVSSRWKILLSPRLDTRVVTCWRLRPKPPPGRGEGDREGLPERSLAWRWLTDWLTDWVEMSWCDFSKLADSQDWTNWRPPSVKSWEPEAVRRLMEVPGSVLAHEDHGTWWRVPTSGEENNLGLLTPHTSDWSPGRTIHLSNIYC